MLISVITANYNGGDFLKDTLEGVINQDFDNYEYIIVDDGSTDVSKEIIKIYHNKYGDKIKPIYRPTNCGQGVCFNIGISASKGSIVCFLDSDDYWFKNKLKNVHKIFLKRTNLAFHQHNLLIMNENKITNQRFSDILINGDYFSHTKNNRELPLFMATSGLSFNRHILEKVLPIPKAFVTCADGYLTRTCFCYGDVYSDNECFGVYRVHDKNNVFGNPKHNDTLYQKNLLIPYLNKYYEANGIDLRFYKSWINKLYCSSLRKALKGNLSSSRFRRLENLIRRFG